MGGGSLGAACAALGVVMGGKEYAIVAGAVLYLLGSTRMIVDVDIVVSMGTIAAA